jgi:indolepyruvate ferredoxin oxidoreductase alpha subunit
MVREAFELSERHQVPVLMRMTTRVCHVKRVVRVEGPLPTPPRMTYARDPQRWVLAPANVAHRLEVRAQRDVALRAEAETSHWNILEPGSDRRVGVIASGPVCHAVREALPQAPLLALGFSSPLPIDLIHRFAATVDAVLVIEESEPVVETELRAAGLPVQGRSLLPPYGEITGEHVARAARAVRGEAEPLTAAREPTAVFTRPPTLCAGCGYLGVYYWLSRLPNAIVCGDIGCYTLGASPPWSAVDTALAMGASLGMASGVAKAMKGDGQARPVIAVIGDSTFLHSGMQGLLNLSYQRANVTVLLLDNRATAMTGGQNNPANGHDLDGGRAAVRVDLAKLVEALGVRAQRIRNADPYELPTFHKILREEMKADEPSVIITTRPCVFTPEFARQPPVVVHEEGCNGCATCLLVGCPAILVTRREEAQRAAGKVVHRAWVAVDAQLCTGCGVCVKSCSRNAIVAQAPKPVVKLECA